MALVILRSLTETIHATLRENLPTLVGIFKKGLQDVESMVRKRALTALAAVVELLEGEEELVCDVLQVSSGK